MSTATMTATQTLPSVMTTTEAPLVAGDVLRAIDTPVVSPPSGTPPPIGGPRNSSPTNSIGKSKGHRRTSSAASDIAKAAGIDLEAVSMAEARKIMSEEHKILGFRPPQGSFAAEVQSLAAKHPEGKPGAVLPDTTKLKEIAREDALRILAERKTSTGADKDAPPAAAKTNGSDKVTPTRVSPPVDVPGVNLNKISATDARVLMSHEHRALGFRPPPGSLAAEAQSAAARHPDGDGTHLDDETLREIALRDAERIKADRGDVVPVDGANLSAVGKEAAATIASVEARALGHPPPSGSIAAEAQSAADKHPAGGSFDPAKNPVEMEQVVDAAREEGEQLRALEESTATTEPSEKTAMEEHRSSPAKADAAVETERMTAAPPSVVRGLVTPPLSRSETGDSVEIVCDVLA
ncbi:uncharacterized protein TRAVEDRAFT_73152 [Trametes versicolor FP-101664 SS1]|uniref:uncharacterized protein n=1 Tax=Trametes versicolor (strain FP-101664) TaxID=717944 RepID=UPI0004621513|nr:uncharacterized protein TRAVEDRAFT_73152 [Trametes versicolor FP-101664 SS1]EIW56690.1 hypothetical protein TRAVEDRAFT_73152 [Trametes versicolor FP-101664 SS1]